MNGNNTFAKLRNGQSIPCADVPEMSFADFRRGILDAVAAGATCRLLRRVPAAGEEVVLHVVLADRAHSLLHVARTRLESDRFASLTPDCPQVHLFEREIAEQFGVCPEGHPWLKPVRFHESYRPGNDAWRRQGGGKPPSSASPISIASRAKKSTKWPSAPCMPA